MNLSSVTDNIQARIAAARQAANEASDYFEKQKMGSKEFFSSFSTWQKLFFELNSLEKTADLMRSSALAGLGKEAISNGIDRIFSTGIKYTPSMITAEAIQNAANGALFGQGTLDTLGHALDGASQDISTTGSNDYMPYGGTGSGFSTFSGDNFSSNYDLGTSNAPSFMTSGSNDPSYQYDGSITSQNFGNTGSFVDTSASGGSVMSGDYTDPSQQYANIDNGNSANDHTRSISAWSGPSSDSTYDSGSSFNAGGTSSGATDSGYSGSYQDSSSGIPQSSNVSTWSSPYQDNGSNNAESTSNLSDLNTQSVNPASTVSTGWASPYNELGSSSSGWSSPYGSSDSSKVSTPAVWSSSSGNNNNFSSGTNTSVNSNYSDAAVPQTSFDNNSNFLSQGSPSFPVDYSSSLNFTPTPPPAVNTPVPSSIIHQAPQNTKSHQPQKHQSHALTLGHCRIGVMVVDNYGLFGKITAVNFVGQFRFITIKMLNGHTHKVIMTPHDLARWKLA